jgi:hypothetical protein
MAKAIDKQQEIEDADIERIKQRAYTQYYRKIRTVYINGKLFSDLEKILDLMLEDNTITLKPKGNEITYPLGDIIYLIDIRYNTYGKSKKTHPNDVEQWFHPKHLKKMFADDERIRYRYCKALGNPPKIRKQEEYKDDPDKQKQLYLQYLQSNHKNLATYHNFMRLYAFLINTDPHFQVCLMCYCQPERQACHRFWLKEALAREYRKRHDLGGGPNLPHYILNKFEKQLKKGG